MDDISARKSTLKKSSEEYRKTLEGQFNSLKDNAEKWGKTVVIVGLSMFVVYKLVRALAGSDEAEERIILKSEGTPYPVPTYTERRYSIFDTIKEQIALFLIAIAREKLMKYLESLENESKDVTRKKTK
ncbi:hypothetical protein QWY31_09450 [Cytophagales bacterium LB-30]|uniref:Uncharacterized protein n=1 Tax=Shiella aurantiaca TaxID=3058365 RepID=A0ABT8F5I2_9BACT|nr:hypothetical protein [Shiella aurantiaca]MDN4165727.1 hypothetical protein [Shiella aurantiaca]